MGADFYPRLTASVNDHDRCNQLVNEQVLIGMLLAGPGVIATLTFAPIIITLLYSIKFRASITLLRWICLGTMVQVVSWPIGFVTVAHGKQNLFIFSEVAWATASLGLSWSCIHFFGIKGAGISFFLSYVVHALIACPIARHLSGFGLAAMNAQTSGVICTAIAIAFSGFYFMKPPFATALGLIVLLLTCAYSLHVLSRVMPAEGLPRPIQRILAVVYSANRQPTAYD